MATKNPRPAPKPKPRKEPATYHDAVFTAFRYILREYVENGDITLQDERRLSKQPLKIDIMIIKKKRDVDIETSWGKIFRGHNIIEYKSPADSLVSLSVFNKVIHGYTGVYASQENVSLIDMSATIVCFKRPVELFEVLKSELNYKILRKDKGVYYILQKGAIAEKSLAIQVLVSSELPDSDVALKELKKKFDKAARVKIAEFIRNLDEESLILLAPWLYFMFLQDGETLYQEINVTKRERLYKLFEKDGIPQKVEREAQLRERQEGRREGRREATAQLLQFLESGHSIQEAREKFLVMS